MPATATIQNMIRDSQVTEDDTGLMIKESWLVTGLTKTARSPLYDALQASGLPAYGDAHPAEGEVYVKSRVPKPRLNSHTEAIVDITWRPKDFGQFTPTLAPRVQFHAFTREVQTSKNRDKTPIKVRYKTTIDGTDTIKERIARVNDYKAMGTLEFDWAVSSDPSSILSYFNTYNSSAWRGGGKWCWHFADIAIEKQKYNPWWNVHATFLYDDETFIRTAFWTDKDGNIPKDVDQPIDPYVEEGSTKYGWKNVRTRDDSDFNSLGLPTGF